MSKCLVLSADLHEVQTFHLKGRMGDVSLNVDDDVRRLAMSWTKLKTFQSSSAQPNVYFLVNFEDNRGELSWIASIVCSIEYFYNPTFQYD